MSKMGQYVFDLMTAEEAEFYGHSDREACTDAEKNQNSRPAAGADGSGGFVRGTDQCVRPNRGTRITAKDFPMATGSTAYEIQRRS
tara:strand:- start:710 stop:967 length:258 start_codon:yes stop_codon:yes gene_type:complete